MLAGARIRESEHSRIELVVVNPSGGNGIYVLNWPGVQALCSPTVHDTLLFQRFRGLSAIHPAHIRGAALAVALEGYAGREAASGAETALANDHKERLRAHLRLLSRLLEPHDLNEVESPEHADVALDRASLILRRLAPGLRRSAAQLAIDLTAIADAFAPVGIAREDHDARIPRVISRLGATGSALFAWLHGAVDDDISGLGLAVAAAIQATAGVAEEALTIVRAGLTDPAALLKRWGSNPADVAAAALRCDWVLDGWERVCLLWTMASSDAMRRAALLEMAPLIPVLPHEAQDWVNQAIPRTAMDETWRVISSRDAWRNGSAALCWIERNEKLRAMST